MATHPLDFKPRWYRSTMFNAFVIGLVGFCAPGLWNAMSSLGAGGQQSPYLVNAANALVFALMGFFCLFGSVASSKIGLKWSLVIGTIGFPVYSAGLYLNNRYGVEWLVLLGAALCGISAGLFWNTEGAIALGYSRPEKRGKYLNIWLIFRTLGPLVGGAIVLALNHSEAEKASGKVGYNTYLIFVALQCLGPLIALFLTPPEKVERADGSKVKILKAGSFWEEVRGVLDASKKKHVLMLLPLFWAAYFNQYSGNFQVYYFGVRARALSAFVGNFASIMASTAMSALLDWKRFSVKSRITFGFYVAVVLHIVAWVYGWVIQEKYTANPPMLDWESPGYVEGFFVMILWGVAYQALANWMYYLVSTMTGNITELNRLTGILRGQESFSQAVAFGLNTRKWYGGRVPLAVNTVLLVLAVFPTWLVVRQHEPITKDDTDNDTLTSSTTSTVEEKIAAADLEKALT
ncbi:MFS general substrate transporter [Hesseltinella vesiculosa]|uniref:MFS general substrate transporter n=1 Tax=Hesseltinella vesiculosa TaxID=101127 RepID=A0A1X2GDT1_9FUNG|nr:MFS general substrate transporter [Hesseltinella vesiculosa]